MTAILSHNGSVPVPEELRAQLGLTPGAALEVEVIDGRLVATPTPTAGRRERWLGRLREVRARQAGGGMPLQQLLDEVRGEGA